MFRKQSSSGNILGKQPRSTEIDNNNYSNYNNNNNPMQLLARRVFLNLTKNALQTPTKLAVSSVAAIRQRNQEALRHYSSAPTKQKLLRFPAIALDETLPRFITSVEPLLTAAELEETKKAVASFNQEEGAALQKLLEKVANKEENWLATRWLKVAYLQYRDPVTVFSSPGMTFPLMPRFQCDGEFVTYAANIVYGLVRYKMMIDNGEIPVVKMGKLELDNSQFERVYGTNRVPQPQEDCLEFNPKSQHIVVIYKNHFYKLNVYSCDGCAPVHPDVLAAELMKVIKAEQCRGIPFGILSTDTRDNWAEAYADLMKSDENQRSIDVIRKAMFTLSLDDDVPMERDEEWNTQSYQLIHGGGSKFNAGNRWMDKTIQVIVNRNGLSGFTYEHSPAEGQPIALMVDYIVKNLKNKSHYDGAAKEDFECIQKLPIKSSKCIDDLFLPAAIRNVDALARDLKMHVLNFVGYGKEFCKMQKLGPDSYIQIALQYAFYKLHKVPAAHYESAHLRIYFGGRTETIRSCSNESVAFAKAMEPESGVSDADRVKLLRAAVNGHQAYTKLALQGRGVDRHLLGLKLMALECDLPIPELYKTPGFVKSTTFRLSTSQVASAYEAFMCYGPLVGNGYGACYNPRECNIIVALSSWNNNEETCATKLAKTLESCFDEMRVLLERHGEQPKSKL